MEQGLEVDAQWWAMADMPLYSEASPSRSLVGMVKGPRDAFLSAGALDKGGREFHQVFGRNRFSRMSLRCMGPTVGKRVWREVTAAGRGGGLPMVSAVLGAGGSGVGCWLSRCLIIRFSRTCSAGRDAARVEARVLSASAPVAEGGGVSALVSRYSCWWWCRPWWEHPWWPKTRTRGPLGVWLE